VELDKWNGKTFASLVGFLFVRTRVLGIVIPFHQNFEEVNLRFYTRRKTSSGWRRGVVFIKEIVPRWAIAAVARMVYGEKYISLPMRSQISRGPENQIEYGWRLGGEWNYLSAWTRGEAAPALPGSEEEFITEHYWGYASQRGGNTVEYQVEHPSWNVWQVQRCEAQVNIPALYGRQFLESLSAVPSSAFVADGSHVTVYQGNKL
jgi:uncharacterized protein YqjF (DUF2071 family)